MTKYQNKLSTLKDTNLVFNKLETNAMDYALAIQAEVLKQWCKKNIPEYLQIYIIRIIPDLLYIVCKHVRDGVSFEIQANCLEQFNTITGKVFDQNTFTDFVDELLIESVHNSNTDDYTKIHNKFIQTTQEVKYAAMENWFKTSFSDSVYKHLKIFKSNLLNQVYNYAQDL